MPQDTPVDLLYRGQVFSLTPGLTLGAALVILKISPELVLAIRSGAYIQTDAILNPGDKIKLVSVIAGG